MKKLFPLFFVVIAIVLVIFLFLIKNPFFFARLFNLQPCDIYIDKTGKFVNPPITCSCSGIKLSYSAPIGDNFFTGNDQFSENYYREFTSGTYCLGRIKKLNSETPN